MKSQKYLKTNLGTLEAVYISWPLETIRIALYLFALLALNLVGQLWETNKMLLTMNVIGGIVLVRLAFRAIVSYRQVRLYKKGICVLQIGGTHLWRYEEIDSVRILGGGSDWINEILPELTLFGHFIVDIKRYLIRLDFLLLSASYQIKPNIEYYQIFAQGEQILKIGPEFQLWEELGKTIFDRVNTWSVSHS